MQKTPSKPFFETYCFGVYLLKYTFQNMNKKSIFPLRYHLEQDIP